jgi:hypothetical protein
MKLFSCLLTLAVCAFALVGAAAVARAAPAAAPATGTTPSSQQGITLEKIMSDPDWIGAPVKDAYWSADGRTVYYSAKRGGSPIVDLHRVDLADRKDQVLPGHRKTKQLRSFPRTAAC